jgi:hypothetical protein
VFKVNCLVCGKYKTMGGQQAMLAFFISVFKKNVGMLELTPW